ncbi:DUF6477 family protein [Celeribacter litoreus]|uniref:DUF6477 family protein n=1 Tax=Celeribacter litoreus TaxID=2876714 RepID=UPI001CCE105B|nr:DUF6477 family protein [Celeribacter litoreus]MCA0045015.1 DUF6477 family protein [Celeribacter litoreus]
MTDLQSALATLRRPSLLIRAARFGMTDYNRTRTLKRLMNISTLPSPKHALSALLDAEARLEETRQSGDAAYSVARHVEVLIALMSEARLFNSTPQSV